MKFCIPKYKSRRIVKKFAIFPVKLRFDEVYVWLEFYYELQEFSGSMWDIHGRTQNTELIEYFRAGKDIYDFFIKT
jgi:hypothetical protein